MGARVGDDREAHDRELVVVEGLDLGDGDEVLAVEPVLERADHAPLVLERLALADEQLELEDADEHRGVARLEAWADQRVRLTSMLR